MRPLLPFLAAALSLVSAWDIGNPNERHACQSYSGNPLEGCDQERTVFVDVGGDSKFKTVQSGKVKVFYRETVGLIVTSRRFLAE